MAPREPLLHELTASGEAAVFRSTSGWILILGRWGLPLAGQPVAMHDQGAALDVLRSLSTLPGGMAALRAFAGAGLAADWPVDRTDDELIEGLAARLASGRLLLHRVEPARIAAPEWSFQEDEEAPAPQPVREDTGWIEIAAVDDDDPPRPVPNARYLIELPDGSKVEGTLDRAGRARVERIPRGMCKVSFPDLDAADWRRA